MKEGLLYIYNGPPIVSGDPQCGKCGGMEFKWVGMCVECGDKEINRWEALKLFLTNGLIEFSQFKECHTGKWEESYNALLSKMEELEKE